MKEEQSKEISIDTYTETVVIARPAPSLGLRVTFPQWDRLCEKIKTMPESSDRERNLAWACVGIVAADVITGLTWLASLRTLDEGARADQTWLAFVYIAIAIVAGAIAYLGFSYDAQTRAFQKWGAQQVIDDMNAIAAPFPRTVVTPPQPKKKEVDPDEIPF